MSDDKTAGLYRKYVGASFDSAKSPRDVCMDTTCGTCHGPDGDPKCPLNVKRAALGELGVKCPTCEQDMNDKPREGYHGMACPHCGQGLGDAPHVRRVLKRLAKSAPAGRVLARGVVEHAVIYHGRRLVIQLRLDRAPARGSGDVDMGASRVEVREAKGG